MISTEQTTTGVRTHRLNLHDTYDVRWSEEMIARDLIQNYYDSVPDHRFETDITIEVDRKDRSVTISGPSSFDPQLLWRIGVGTKSSDKSDLFAGGFGEGFAVAVLQLLRNWPAMDVSVTVGHEKLSFRYEEIALEKSTARELVCDVTETAPTNGSVLVLSNSPIRLLRAFEEGHQYFDYPGNPLFGRKVSNDTIANAIESWYRSYCRRPGCQKCAGPWAEEIKRLSRKRAKARSAFETAPVTIYLSNEKKGAIFYRRQLRAELDVPVVIACRQKIGRINTGRDRLNLNATEVKAVFSHCLVTLDPDAIEALVLGPMRQFWTSGHPLLAALAEAFNPCRKPAKSIKFPDEFYASHGNIEDRQEAARSSKKVCPWYMNLFGMPMVSELRTKKEDVDVAQPQPFAPRGSTANPFISEAEGFNILRDAYRAVFPPTSRENRERALAGWTFLVFEPKEDQTELEGFNDKQIICLKRAAFRGSFNDAFTTFLHEAHHRFGRDGSYAFGKALEYALEALIESLDKMDEFEQRWERNRVRHSAFPASLIEFGPYCDHLEDSGLLTEEVAKHALPLITQALKDFAGWDVLSLPFKQGKTPKDFSPEERAVCASLFSLFGRIADDRSSLIEAADEDNDQLVREAYHTALLFNPGHETSADLLANSYIWHDEDFNAARTVLDASLRANDRSHIIHACLGELNRLDERSEESVAAYRRALELAPHIMSYAEGAARSLTHLGRWLEAYNELLPFITGIRGDALLSLRYDPLHGLFNSGEFILWYLNLAKDLEAGGEKARERMADHFWLYHLITELVDEADPEMYQMGWQLAELWGKETAKQRLMKAAEEFCQTFRAAWMSRLKFDRELDSRLGR